MNVSYSRRSIPVQKTLETRTGKFSVCISCHYISSLLSPYFPYIVTEDILTGFVFLMEGVGRSSLRSKSPETFREVTVKCKKENAMYCMYFRGQS